MLIVVHPSVREPPMPRPSKFAISQEWVTATEAKRIVGCSGQAAILRLVVIGQVRARTDPGCSPRFNRGDCERVAALQAQPQLVGA
jgi:hypothetical protein